MTMIIMILSMGRQTSESFKIILIHRIMHTDNTGPHETLLCIRIRGNTLILFFELLLEIFKVHKDYVEDSEYFGQVIEAC